MNVDRKEPMFRVGDLVRDERNNHYEIVTWWHDSVNYVYECSGVNKYVIKYIIEPNLRTVPNLEDRCLNYEQDNE